MQEHQEAAGRAQCVDGEAGAPHRQHRAGDQNLEEVARHPEVSGSRQGTPLPAGESMCREQGRMHGRLGCVCPCSVVAFKGVWEDAKDIHLVMEYCSGGELHHTIGQRAYTEETVAGYMRSVLQTLAQCHSHRILHRDVKPGNFMLLNDAEDAPLKAIDFGLGMFFEPDHLPRTDLGLDGTPWFMAPEVLSSQTYPGQAPTRPAWLPHLPSLGGVRCRFKLSAQTCAPLNPWSPPIVHVQHLTFGVLGSWRTSCCLGTCRLTINATPTPPLCPSFGKAF